MSIQNLLQQILQSGKGLAQDAGTKLNSQSLSQSPLGGFGGGAAMGGALGLLLGNKKFRKMGGSLAGYGGAAALGALALKTYQDWQNRQATPTPGAATGSPSAQATPLRLTDVETPQMEQHSRAMLAAMIAAAKADGHIGDPEKALIESEVQRLSASEADRRWVHEELEKPADPASIAALSQSPEMAAEIYLASLLVTEQDSFMERAYLDELARALQLDPSLKADLENNALQAQK